MRYCWLFLALAPQSAAWAAALPARPVFCVVTAGHVSVCNYTSKVLCARDAGMQQAVCEPEKKRAS